MSNSEEWKEHYEKMEEELNDLMHQNSFDFEEKIRRNVRRVIIGYFVAGFLISSIMWVIIYFIIYLI